MCDCKAGKNENRECISLSLLSLCLSVPLSLCPSCPFVSLSLLSLYPRLPARCTPPHRHATLGDSRGSRRIPILADWKAMPKRKNRYPSFNETLDTLRAHGFTVAPFSGIAGGMSVSKNGVGAVLAPVEGASAAFAVRPGVFVQGEIARLVDRGYQKFIKTSKYELPATAAQLHAIHAFSEELKDLTGGISLYNESLGTTSDRYLYDRLKGREEVQPNAARPWELTAGH
jgi:hypothetical protein